jgi:predicted SnoaL-like aldol condensation-catalyzing enzyme
VCRALAADLCDKVAVRSSVEGIATPDGDARPVLIEIFRIDDGRLAEMWGITEGPDPRLRKPRHFTR